MTQYLGAFIGGFLGSAHCVGMCGGIAALVGAPRCTPKLAVRRQLVYSSGRVFTYAFLGVIAGSASAWLSHVSGGLLQWQRGFSIAAGVVMVLIGVSTFGWFRLKLTLPAAVSQPVVITLREFLGTPDYRAAFLAGVLNGFLPCGLVYAFLAFALTTGHPIQGAVLMIAFGLGTIPAMTVVGCGSTFISHHARAKVFKLAAALVIITGGITIYRAVPSRANCCSHEIITEEPASAEQRLAKSIPIEGE